MSTFSKLFHRLLLLGLLAVVPMMGTGCSDDAAGDGTITKISIIPGTATLNVGKTITFAVRGIMDNDTFKELTSELTWESSDTSIATVEGGLTTAMAVGTATIKVTYKDFTAEAEVTDKERNVSQIQVTPP